MKDAPLAVVIGAGSTGAALAHDLALRGLRVIVLERAGIASGSTGHNQAQLHSGARYAVVDQNSAKECIQENWILRQILPQGLELNDGLFVAVDEAGLAYRPRFLQACTECAIPWRELSAAQALQMEPLLNPGLITAVQIPDGVFDPYRLCLSFLASACQRGAQVHTFCEVIGLDPALMQVTYCQRRALQTAPVRLRADVIFNAAGPWVGQVAALGGLLAPVSPSAGAMLTIDRRVSQRVLNLLAPPGDGDIIVPQRTTSILGTTSWEVSQPGDIPVPPEHIESIYRVAEQLVPAVRQAHMRGAMAAARPLLAVEGAQGRSVTRAFACYQHSSQGAPGVFSLVGGKTSTARLMAEQAADLACAYLGITPTCQTRTTPLASYRKWVSA